jgi:cold shock CspA family protein
VLRLITYIVIMNGKKLNGTVIWFDEKKGFGIIHYKEDNEKPKQYFAHQSEINVKNDIFRALYEDENVEFIHSYNEEKKKLVATNITGIDGNKLKCEYKKEDDIHKKNNKKKYRLIKKNTESFEPDHSPPDLRLYIEDGSKDIYPRHYDERDVVVINNMFFEFKINEIYEKLLDEIKTTGSDDEIWKLWHGDTHYIADDRRPGWKEKCPTFSMVVDRISKYFEMDVKATRFNLYRDAKEWKPFHHDAAAVDPKKAKTQNLTVGVSFGSVRDVAFQHAKARTVVSIPLSDGMIYTFGNQVNIDWRHGIPQIANPTDNDKGRLSIILWGKNKQDIEV